MGTVNVPKTASLFGVERVVYTSAKGVYGASPAIMARRQYEP